MLQTPNYGLDIYEPNDVTSYLTTYNQTMTKIDATIKVVEDTATKNSTGLTALEAQVTNHTKQLEELTTEQKTLTNDVSGLLSNVQEIRQNVTNQDIKITGIQNDLTNVETLVGDVYRGVLTAGETTLAITIGEFTDTTLVDIYASIYGVSPLTAELRAASGGQPNLCVTTWDTQTTDIDVAVLIR